MREGIGTLIAGTPRFAMCEQYGSTEEAIEQIREDPPDVLLADIRHPGVSGIEGVRRIHELMPALLMLNALGPWGQRFRIQRKEGLILIQHWRGGSPGRTGSS